MASATTVKTPQILRLAIAATAERPSVNIRVILDEKSGRYVNASVAVEHPAIAVTPTLLGRMRLGQLRRDALRASLAEQNPELLSQPALKSFFRGTSGRTVAEKIRVTPSVEHLQTVALIYHLARLTGDYPVQAVGRSFGLDRADAVRWVALARKTGAL